MSGLFQSFLSVAERYPDRVAVEVQRADCTERTSYDRLRRMAESAAGHLLAAGARPGQRWAILADNSVGWCAAYLGMTRLGLVAVPLDTNYSAAQVAKLLADSGAEGLLVSAGPAASATAALERREIPVFGIEPATGFEALDFEASAPTGRATPVEPSDPALILYTSGTTHDPKGVVLTHHNLASICDAARVAVDMTPEDSVLSVLPLFHALAHVANLALPLTLGSRAVFIETVNTTELLRALREREVSVFCCVPQFFYLVYERVMGEVARARAPVRALFRAAIAFNGWSRDRLGINFGKRLFARVHAVMGPSMRLLVTGGSRFDPVIGRDLYRLGFDILQAYGLTETTGGISVLRPGDRHVASVGQPVDGVEVKILPPADAGVAHDPPPADRVRGRPASPIGEIAARGPVVTPGYYHRPDADAEAFQDGWFRTGDLGYLDDEGRLYITGRAKEIIVTSSGKNIYPEEIEAHYLQAESIGELCVLAVSRPDEPSAERLHGIIVPDFEALKRRKIVNTGEFVRWEVEELSAKLPSHKRILSYTIVQDPLPRTTTRKLKRLEIERRFAAGEFESDVEAAATERPDDPEWLADAHVAAVLDAVRTAVRDPQKVRGSANLELDLGLDSMERVELLTEVETRFRVHVGGEVAQRIYTVRDLVEALRVSGGDGPAGERIEDAWPTILSRSDASDPDVSEFFRSRAAALALFVGLKLLAFVCWLLLGLRVRGREHLPSAGPFLLCPNHQSYIDGFLLAAALPFRVQSQVFIVGASEYFETPLMTRLARAIRLVPVDPDANLTRAMRVGARGLRDGRVLMLFPEGERSIDGDVKRFKKGAAILSSNIGAPIVPVAIRGAHEAWPRGRGPRWSRFLPGVGRLTLAFGEAVAFERNAGAPDYAQLTDRLRSRVVELYELAGARP